MDEVSVSGALINVLVRVLKELWLDFVKTEDSINAKLYLSSC